MKYRVYLVMFLLLVPIVAALLFLIPVTMIPGNDLAFQAVLYAPSDYVLLFSLATAESLLLVMLFYLFWSKQSQRVAIAGRGGLGILGVIPAFLFGSKLCPMCLAAMLGLFGFGTGAVLPLLHYRQWIFAVSLIVMFISIYLISRRIVATCTECA